jgi:hypothetical protein
MSKRKKDFNMGRVYRITPLEKKSIYAHYEMYRSNADGSTSWFNIDDSYRWGTGFIEEDMDCNLPYRDDDTAYCDPNVGWGAELEDRVSCFFEFSDDLSDLEKQVIEDAYYEDGIGWLYDGEHEWEEEDSSIVVQGPFKVDLCEDDGTVLEENFELKTRPNLDEVKTAAQEWPFSNSVDMPGTIGSATLVFPNN